jgi:hypothetical protein
MAEAKSLRSLPPSCWPGVGAETVVFLRALSSRRDFSSEGVVSSRRMTPPVGWEDLLVLDGKKKRLEVRVSSYLLDRLVPALARERDPADLRRQHAAHVLELVAHFLLLQLGSR